MNNAPLQSIHFVYSNIRFNVRIKAQKKTNLVKKDREDRQEGLGNLNLLHTLDTTERVCRVQFLSFFATIIPCFNLYMVPYFFSISIQAMVFLWKHISNRFLLQTHWLHSKHWHRDSLRQLIQRQSKFLYATDSFSGRRLNLYCS